MLKILLLTMVFMGAIVLIMSVGVLFKRKPIQGSCGGMSALGMKSDCEVCGGNDEVCDELSRKDQPGEKSLPDLSYDAAPKRK